MQTISLANPVPSPRSRAKPSASARSPNLRRLTARVVDLTRRRQLAQIFEEVEQAKSGSGWPLNRVVMNAVLEACVRCRDVDAARRVFDEMAGPGGCGVDGISFAILLKGLGNAKRVDEAFEILENLDVETVLGNGGQFPRLIYGLLNALLEAGNMRRANALVARYRHVLYEEGDPVLLFNLLMKGYINIDFPLGALTIKGEILKRGLKLDKLTYNTLISACVRSRDMEKALQLLEDMKVATCNVRLQEVATESNREKLLPDIITYTTLLKGMGECGDRHSILKLVVEMRSSLLHLDRIAYSTMVDALLSSGAIKEALCIFGEMIKLAGRNRELKPKPHFYLLMMRAFASLGDFNMVKKLNTHMWSYSVGSISPSAQAEANGLLLEAALQNGLIDVAGELLSNIINTRKFFSWTSRGGLAAVRVEALSGFTNHSLKPYIFPQILLKDPVEKYMIPFEESRPLPSHLLLEKVEIRFIRERVIPVIDDCGRCIGVLHRHQCVKMDSPVSAMMTAPPPCVSTSTSVGNAINLILESNCELVVVVRTDSAYVGHYSLDPSPVGVFSLHKLKSEVSVSDLLQDMNTTIL